MVGSGVNKVDHGIQTLYGTVLKHNISIKQIRECADWLGNKSFKGFFGAIGEYL